MLAVGCEHFAPRRRDECAQARQRRRREERLHVADER